MLSESKRIGQRHSENIQNTVRVGEESEHSRSTVKDIGEHSEHSQRVGAQSEHIRSTVKTHVDLGSRSSENMHLPEGLLDSQDSDAEMEIL